MALVSYDPDDLWRNWRIGQRFERPPNEPVVATIERNEGGLFVEMWDVPLPLMSTRLATAIREAGVANIEFYKAEIRDKNDGRVNRDYFAFNLIGTIAAADMRKSRYEAPGGEVISVAFDSLVLDTDKARGEQMFRLAESINGIVVRDDVKGAIERAGINTLTFMAPEDWMG